MAEEDEEKELAIEKCREPDGNPIRAQEGEIGCGVAGDHFSTFSRQNVTGASSRTLVRSWLATPFQNPQANPR